MGTGSNTAALAGTYGNTGGATLGAGGGSMTTFSRGVQGYTGSPSVSGLTFGQPSYSSGFVSGGRTFMPGGPPGTAGSGSNPFGFMDSFENMYGLTEGLNAISAGLAKYSGTKLEQQAYEWKAEIYRKQWQLKQRQIEDRKITGKQEEDALRRKYQKWKNKINPSAGKRHILAGGGSVMDILAGVEVTELADRGLLKTNVQKDIYGLKVGQWSDKMDETMNRRRASMSDPVRAGGMTMLTSAMQSGMKYWKYKNSMPGSFA